MRFALVLGRLLCAFPAYCLCLARSDAMLWLRYFSKCCIRVCSVRSGAFCIRYICPRSVYSGPARACLRVLYLAFPCSFALARLLCFILPDPTHPRPALPRQCGPGLPCSALPLRFLHCPHPGIPKPFPPMIHRILPRKQRDPAVRAPYFSCPEGSSAPPCGMLFPARKKIFKK